MLSPRLHVAPKRERARACAKGSVASLRGRGDSLHGCRPLYQPVVVSLADSSFSKWAQRPGHRLAALEGGYGNSPVEAGDDLALLQPADKAALWQRLHRCPVRLQGTQEQR